MTLIKKKALLSNSELIFDDSMKKKELKSHQVIRSLLKKVNRKLFHFFL